MKEVLDGDSVSVRYIVSADQAADIFTKAPETLEKNSEPKSVDPAALSTPAKLLIQVWKAMRAISEDLVRVRRRLLGATVKE
eukprot:6629597-Karenia_brevis.AAC.1